MKVQIDREEDKEKVTAGLRVLAKIIARKIIEEDQAKTGISLKAISSGKPSLANDKKRKSL